MGTEIDKAGDVLAARAAGLLVGEQAVPVAVVAKNAKRGSQVAGELVLVAAATVAPAAPELVAAAKVEMAVMALQAVMAWAVAPGRQA